MLSGATCLTLYARWTSLLVDNLYGTPKVWSSVGMKGQGKQRDPRENPPTSGIVGHDSHMRKSGSDPAGVLNPDCHECHQDDENQCLRCHFYRWTRDTVAFYSSTALLTCSTLIRQRRRHLSAVRRKRYQQKRIEASVVNNSEKPNNSIQGQDYYKTMMGATFFTRPDTDVQQCSSGHVFQLPCHVGKATVAPLPTTGLTSHSQMFASVESGREAAGGSVQAPSCAVFSVMKVLHRTGPTCYSASEERRQTSNQATRLHLHYVLRCSNRQCDITRIRLMSIRTERSRHVVWWPIERTILKGLYTDMLKENVFKVELMARISKFKLFNSTCFNGSSFTFTNITRTSGDGEWNFSVPDKLDIPAKALAEDKSKSFLPHDFNPTILRQDASLFYLLKYGLTDLQNTPFLLAVLSMRWWWLHTRKVLATYRPIGTWGKKQSHFYNIGVIDGMIANGTNAGIQNNYYELPCQPRMIPANNTYLSEEMKEISNLQMVYNVDIARL
ncbi:hypothetical protein PR048_021198 [Dryococelus australis]|uniref:Uncharacterized protein n=1 Tax=Dryococelus australis TaxID=614101 RepID=A0ABQ9GXI9_9NEOP|nr:hypothetical protein PR048_021198 [Dryococelus australis]